jgi:hypothetical protein
MNVSVAADAWAATEIASSFAVSQLQGSQTSTRSRPAPTEASEWNKIARSLAFR